MGRQLDVGVLVVPGLLLLLDEHQAVLRVAQRLVRHLQAHLGPAAAHGGHQLAQVLHQIAQRERPLRTAAASRVSPTAQTRYTESTIAHRLARRLELGLGRAAAMAAHRLTQVSSSGSPSEDGPCATQRPDPATEPAHGVSTLCIALELSGACPRQPSQARTRRQG